MSKLKLKHASGNSMSISAPATNPDSDLELKLPSTVGASGQVLRNSSIPGTLEFGPATKNARNLIINGAMQIAQRGTSLAATSQSSSFSTVDRWKLLWNHLGVNGIETQGDVGSSDAPYDLGFRKYHRIALASAGTASANSYIEYDYGIEAQDIATSTWDYTSASSYITLSFWFRPSTNQTFYATLRTKDGSTEYGYTFSFTATANNTWTKVTHSIPGNANLQFDNDNGPGLYLYIIPFMGTTYSGSSSLNSYRTWDGNVYCPDMATTWLTAGASTFDITGVQLEVGATATDFEHRSYTEELARCQRYYWQTPANNVLYSRQYNSGNRMITIMHPQEMRVKPDDTITCTAGSMTTWSQSGNISENNRYWQGYDGFAYDSGSVTQLSSAKFDAEL